MFSFKKFGIYLGIITAISFVLSLIYKAGNTYSMINSLFIVSGLFLIVSGIRFVYEMGGYNLMIYSFRKISFFGSKKKKYVTEILEENEEEERKRIGNAEKVEKTKKAKDMTYEEYTNSKKDKWGTTNELFAASLTMIVLSLVISWMIIN